MGEKWSGKKQSSTVCFIFRASKLACALYTRFQFFSTRVLDIHLGGLKAACIGFALSKLRPSFGDCSIQSLGD